MLTPETIAAYRKNRAEGFHAADALRHVRYLTKPPARPELDGFGEYGHDKAEWTQDGYTVRVRIADDYDATPDWLGSFTDTWTPDVLTIYPHRRGEYKYFRPENTEREHFTSLYQHCKYGRTQARELAREYVRRDYKRAMSLGQEWMYQGVVATVYRQGVELGSASVWGIESDSDASHFQETAVDMAHEALTEAKATLAKLCGGSDA